MGFDALQYCTFFHNCTAIPVRYFDRDGLALQIPADEEFRVFFEPYQQPLATQPKLVNYLMTRQSMFYGIVKLRTDPQQCMVIGPLASVRVDRDVVKRMLQEADLPLRKAEEVTERFQSFPVLSFQTFLHYVTFLHYSVNGAVETPEEMAGVKDGQFALPIAAEYTSRMNEAREHQQFHNTYDFERQVLRLVEDGDLTGLRSLLDRPVHITPGTVADNNLRQAKNLFIAAATLTTRAAIAGGLDMEAAYQLSDVYIQKMEQLPGIDSVSKLQYQMVIDFTQRVHASKSPRAISRAVRACKQYIHQHINQPIAVEDAARHIQISRSYLSRKFKEEVGIGINEYIRERKVEEAKVLLAFTSQSISEISSYLGFSSQSYFQKVFLKTVGVTPNRFRAGLSRELTTTS